MHGKEHNLESASDILITAMEQADDIVTVAVLSVLNDGSFVVMTNADCFTQIGMAEHLKRINLNFAHEEE